MSTIEKILDGRFVLEVLQEKGLTGQLAQAIEELKDEMMYTNTGLWHVSEHYSTRSNTPEMAVAKYLLIMDHADKELKSNQLKNIVMDNTQLKKELQNIIDKFEWEKVEGYTITNRIGETFTLSFETDMSSKVFPIQVVAAINTGGRRAWTWGCINAEDTLLVVQTFLAIKNKIRNADDKKGDEVAAYVKSIITK
jgi:hypothetical protein